MLVDDVTRRLIEQVDRPAIGLPGDDEKVNALLRVRRLLDSRILVGHPVKRPRLGRERVGRDIRAHAAEDDFCHSKFVCRSRQCTNARDRENECEKRISKPESRIANRSERGRSRSFERRCAELIIEFFSPLQRLSKRLSFP
jgi:hypothetical protein